MKCLYLLILQNVSPLLFKAEQTQNNYQKYNFKKSKLKYFLMKYFFVRLTFSGTRRPSAICDLKSREGATPVTLKSLNGVRGGLPLSYVAALCPALLTVKRIVFQPECTRSGSTIELLKLLAAVSIRE